MTSDHAATERRTGLQAVRELGRYLLARAPWPVARVFGLMMLASVTEGISVLLLIPIVKLVGPSGALAVPTGWLEPWLGAQLDASLSLLLGGFVFLLALRAVLMRHKDLATASLLYGVINDLRGQLFASVARAHWQFVATLRGSDINHALTADIDRVHAAAFQVLQLTQTAVMLVVYAAVAVVIAPAISLLAALIGIAMIGVTTPIRRAALRYGKTLTGQRQQQYHIISEFLGGLKLAKASNTEPIFVERLATVLDATRAGTLRFLRLYSLGGLVFQIVSATALAGFVYVAIAYYAMSSAEIIALIFVFVRLAPRFAAVQSAVHDILTNISALDAMTALTRACDAHAEPRAATEAAIVARHEVEFRDVGFAYDGGDGRRATLQGVSFVIPAAQVTALVGPSGSGKTTIADLLIGLFAPHSGDVLVDGVPLDAERRRAWRSGIAYIPQDCFLMHDTIAVNLAFGQPAVTEADMWSALRLANAERFVRNTPHGLNTIVGDRGLRLSGGERQRIALARALLRRPHLLVLDEATSSLDWENQALIAAAIEGLRGTMTVVTIAHRPSMIAFADWVVAIEDGRVTEAGAYRELAQTRSSNLHKILAAEA